MRRALDDVRTIDQLLKRTNADQYATQARNLTHTLLSSDTEPATAAAALLAIHEDLAELAGELGIIRSTTEDVATTYAKTSYRR